MKKHKANKQASAALAAFDTAAFVGDVLDKARDKTAVLCKVVIAYQSGDETAVELVSNALVDAYDANPQAFKRFM